MTHLAFSAWFPQRFLATINSTVIDWFQPWPESSLLSVARKFLDEVDLVSEPVRNAVVEFMPFSFGAVNNVSFVCLGAGSCTWAADTMQWCVQHATLLSQALSNLILHAW